MKGSYYSEARQERTALGTARLFEMLTGKAPFGDKSRSAKYEVFRRINKGKIKWPAHVAGDTRLLIQGLLCTRQDQRFGWQQTTQHAWFNGVDWAAVERRRIQPPWVPRDASSFERGDHSNFGRWREPRYPHTKGLSAAELQYSDVLASVPSM